MAFGSWLFGFLAFGFLALGFLALLFVAFVSSASSASPVAPQHHRLLAFLIFVWWLLTSHVSVDGVGCAPASLWAPP